ncbi:hypothetical protein GYMLUDRAFT_38777 [Collybiopsis luxurians FD-317 M1]|nr:hypothetical protein GYMLUDRAFT_38777 [Collybiopsis luxurians FD-317 M1]
MALSLDPSKGRPDEAAPTILTLCFSSSPLPVIMRIYNNHVCYVKTNESSTRAKTSVNPHDAMRKSQRIASSKKVADKRESIKNNRQRSLVAPDRLCAYVGNIHPLTTISEVTDLFQDCEGVLEIKLRTGHGSVLRTSLDTPISDLDVQFATVQVSEWTGLAQAMKKNGSTLGGRRLVVGLTSAVLPEMDRLLYEHFHGAGAVHRKTLGGKPLRAEPTEIIEEKRNGDVIIWSTKLVTFPITLM